MKKLRNLSWESYARAEIREGDVILVDNIAEYSERTITSLKERVTIIISDKQNKRLSEEFTIINKKNLKLQEMDEFALVDPEELQKEKVKKGLLSTIVQQYKETRKLR